MLLACAVIAAAAYLLGSIPTGYLLVRFARHQDIRALGSGNIGATNVLRSGGKGLGAATFLLDVLKGCASVWLGSVGMERLRCRSLNRAPAAAARFPGPCRSLLRLRPHVPGLAPLPRR